MQPKSLKFLRDVERAISFIEQDMVGATRDSYLQDRRTRQLVERNLEIVGEALIRLRRADPETAARLTDLQRIIGLRNRLAHGYEEEIDDELVWQATRGPLALLRIEVDALLRDVALEGNDDDAK